MTNFCKVCGHKLRRNNVNGCCATKDCRREWYHMSERYRKARLLDAKFWRARKSESDPDWADKRKEETRVRMNALNAKRRSMRR